MGVREKDHKMVMASLAWGTRGDEGTRRPTRRYTDGFQETHWLKYEQMLLDRTQEIKRKWKIDGQAIDSKYFKWN
eukprot:2430365-Pleurochrysis_carterae.AAC.2